MSRTRRQGGQGLGLALAKQLIELHDSTIEAASAGRGKGATFAATLLLLSAWRNAQEERPTGER